MGLVKEAAFFNELEKLGIAQGIVAKLLLKQLPKALTWAAKRFGAKGTTGLIKGKGLTSHVYRGLIGLQKSKTAYTARSIYRSGVSRAATKFGKPNFVDFGRKGGLKAMQSNFGKGRTNIPTAKP